MKNPIRFLLLLVCALGVSAQETVHWTAMPSATLAELAQYPVYDRPPREIHHPRFTFPVTLGPIAGAAEPPRVAPTLPAPALRTSFDSDTTNRLSPADSSGAVGRNHVVSVSNNGIVVHDRGGNQLAKVALEQFWAEPSRRYSFYDPRGAYDPVADRWIVMSLDGSRTLVMGVSKTGDPAGEWFRYQLPLTEAIDFSRLALTRDSVIIGTNRQTQGATFIFRMAKSDFYSGAPQSPATQYTFAGWVTPVHAPNDAVEYVVRTGITSADVRRLGDPAWTRIEAGFTWQTSETYAPQAGTDVQLEVGVGDVEHAIWHDGVIHLVHTIIANGRAAVLWWAIDPVRLSVRGANVIASNTEYYSFPSIAINRHGAMIIGFSVFSPTSYASSSYVYRDPQGRFSAVAPLRRGDSAVKFSERWGDYTTTVVDPRDEESFWTVQIHAANATWATAWGNIVVPPQTLRRRSVR